jgi:hypothetical protein
MISGLRYVLRNKENDLTYKLHANIMSKILTTAGIDQSSLSGKEILDAGCDIMDFKTQKRFDHVFCLGVLHHTNDPYGRFLHRAKRVCIQLTDSTALPFLNL